MLAALGVGVEAVARHQVQRQQQPRRVAALGLGQRLARQLHALLLHQRVARGLALRAEEAEAHRAADQDRVGDVEEAIDQRRPCRTPWPRRGPPRAAARATRRSRAAWRPRAPAAARPPTGRCSATPAVEAWARWAAPKASFTNASPSAARLCASAGSFFVSPGSQRVFSSTSTSPGSSASAFARASSPTTSRRLGHGRVDQLAQPLRGGRQRGLGLVALRPAQVRAAAPAARLASRAAARWWAARRGSGRRR